MDGRPCPLCGGTVFVGGWMKAADAGAVSFVAEGRGFGDWRSGGQKGDVTARMGRGCGRLDLFVSDDSE